MDRTVWAGLAAVAFWFSAPAIARPKMETPLPSAEHDAIFEEIDNTSAVVADAAYSMRSMAERQFDPRSQLPDLDLLRNDINRIGKELRGLESERDLLTAWQLRAIDQVLPLMSDAARNTEKAILTYNSSQNHLWATSYVDDAARVSKDADAVARLLREYLNLEKAQAKEMRLKQALDRTARL